MYFCTCPDAKLLQNSNTNLFEYSDDHGWLLKWLELSEEPGYTQAHRYGIIIKYCPLCGEKLKT